ncbi:hypothetical protein [Engelhardtia mirabilis]|uniref:Uncharacterized protein n=1 Tax=Engelhardtia mirabilis TaxID=2528011 RepID=A0A518BHG0_9BACT|nr:hypothetical protein Pla133_14900 [Planctomycetes bacterium Pla133]QDV00744.1 hypothetical protein Pla86_14890 [Planctomycetes bacterium Pla86]
MPNRAEPNHARPTRAVDYVAWTGALVLVALHLDFWRTAQPRLIAGLVPEELAWRLAWMVLATAYLFWFTARVWREREGKA